MRDPGGRLPSLTGLRFLAAVVVVLLHIYEHVDGEAQRVLAPVSRAGFVGVLFFFVLSGYLLSWNARPGVVDFYRRRFARIYPAFIASLGLGLVVAVIIGRRPGASSALNLLLLQSWSPHQLVVNMLNAPGWSLSAEAFFYALFPALLIWVERASRTWLVVIAAVSWAAVTAAGILASLERLDTQTQAFLGRLPLLLLGAFAVGVVAARAQREGWLPRLPLLPALLVAGALYLLCCWSPMVRLTNLVLLPAMVVVVMAAAQADLAGTRSVWRTARLQRLGAESYCLYLVHWPILDLLSQRPIGLNAWWVVVLALPIALVVAGLLHRTVEQPAERWLRPHHGLSVADVA